MEKEYDVVIIGSGIGGSTLAIALGKIGCRTLVVEKNQHPRFSIGEATIPSATLTYFSIANQYEIPEFKEMSHYLGLKKLGITCFPKSNFWFGLHEEGEKMPAKHELMMETFQLPYGPDVHVVRSELDAYLVSLFDKYGVDYIDQTTVESFSYDQASSTAILTTNSESFSEIKSHLVIDASGHNGFIATQQNLIKKDALRTSTRAIFSHFKNIPGLDDIYEPYDGYRIKREGGTSHHCFDGGWVWIIRFNDGTASVGIDLDTKKYPINESLEPFEEMMEIIGRYPSIQEHLGKMEPIRNVVRTGRIQFSTEQIVGDGYILTPHASGFIDPLYSTGIALTMTFIERLLPKIKKALFYKDFSKEQFEPLERQFKREVDAVDMVVDASIKSFYNYDLYKQFHQLWASSQIFQVFSAGFGDLEDNEECNSIYGSYSEKWYDLIQRMHAVVDDKKMSTEDKTDQLFELNKEYPNPFDTTDWEVNSDEPCFITIIRPTKEFIDFAKNSIEEAGIELTKKPHIALDLLSKAVMDAGTMRANYAVSKLLKGTVSADIDELYDFVVSPHYSGGSGYTNPFAIFGMNQFSK